MQDGECNSSIEVTKRCDAWTCMHIHGCMRRDAVQTSLKLHNSCLKSLPNGLSLTVCKLGLLGCRSKYLGHTVS